MKHILFFCSLLLSATFLFADEDRESKAFNYWDNLPRQSHSDPDVLDEFIKQFPNTEAANVAFAWRFWLLDANPTIEGYNNFLAQHPNTPIKTDRALQALFNLCVEYGKAPYWMDFLARHPDCVQGVVAKLNLETMFAEYVFLRDKEEAYDDFIEIFPDAPQIPAAIRRASQLARKDEEEFRAKLVEQYKDDYNIRENELKKRAYEIINKRWLKWHTDLGIEREDSGDNDIMKNGKAVRLMAQINRYEPIILDLYGQYEPAVQVRAEKRHQEILRKLDSIQETLLNNHRELVMVIREESEKTRETLREEFAKLGYKLDSGFNALGQKLDVLHNDLVNVYAELQKVNQNLENIQASIEKGNQLLASLNDRLNEVNDQLGALNNNVVNLTERMDQQFNTLINEVHEFRQETAMNLDTIINNQREQIKIAYDTLEVSIENLQATNDIRNQNKQLINLAEQTVNSLGRIEYNQAQQLNEMRGMRKDIKKEFRNLNKHLDVGLANVQTSIFRVGQSINDNISRTGQAIINSNRATVQAMQQAQQQSSRRSGGLRGFLSKVVKGAATVVGGICGGPAGAALGGAVGGALGSVIDGGNRNDHAQAAIQGGFSGFTAPIPKSSQVWEEVVKVGTNELKPRITKYVEDNFPAQTVPLINTMLNNNLKKSKAAAIATISSMGLKMDDNDIKRINQSSSLDGIKSNIRRISERNGENPDAVRYAMNILF